MFSYFKMDIKSSELCKVLKKNLHHMWSGKEFKLMQLPLWIVHVCVCVLGSGSGGQCQETELCMLYRWHVNMYLFGKTCFII